MFSTFFLYIFFFVIVFFNIIPGGSEEELAVYQSDGDIIMLESGTGSAQAEEIWRTFSKIVPYAWRDNIDDLRIIDMPLDDTYAYITQDEEREKYWDMTLNLGFINVEVGNGMPEDEAIVDTVVHELGHIISLREGQVIYGDTSDNCPGYSIDEGCLATDSYLSLFIEKFWPDERLREKAYDGEDVYTGYEDDFVSDYAASNPEEDFSESFMMFVLYEWPPGDSTYLYEQKILFFSQFPELVELADTIVYNLYEYE